MTDIFAQMFELISKNLIVILPGILFAALLFRYFAYKSGKTNHSYFTTFSRQAEKILNQEDKYEKIDDVDKWLNSFLAKIVKNLPDRSLRGEAINKGGSLTKSGSSFRHKDKESMTQFADGKRSIINAVKQQVEAFKSPHPPNFLELTDRVLTQDRKWNTLMGIIPMKTLSRMLDVLPGLFVIGGIFGTFIGITEALPQITKIDLNDFEASRRTIGNFVIAVTYSMNTSIAGIVCSVVMMILNAIFPINTSRAEVRKNLERSFEFMWYRLNGSQLSPGEQKIVRSLDRINSSLGGRKRSSPKKKTKSRAGRRAA